MAFKVVSLEKLSYFLTKLKGLFVEQEKGKGLSTNDFTTAEQTKLAGIADGAEVNVLEGVQVNGSDLIITDKKVNVDLSNYALKTDVTGAMVIKGTVATYTELPASPETGDTYCVTTADEEHNIEAGELVTYNGTEWVDVGGAIDLSAYQTVAGLEDAVKALGFVTEDEVAGEIDLSNYLTKAEASSTYQTIEGMSAYATTASVTEQLAGYMAVADYPEATDEEIDALFE